ncbi:hypothetical protein N3K66_004151 [Trichothecium roseum]|uniref:Uncharacterized protein n=1 Tax=Trichothecium roseum TaxID=47278 RepID=A0ACC0V0E6_9HYPO|nr:hypothetical protein N3K66_004151 [Trichothecium roseum]
MSDARALLRQQREARRINHPQASYSSTGALLCLACRVPVKTESRWESHLRSDQHLLASAQQQSRAPSSDEDEAQQQHSAAGSTAGKRKYGSDTDDMGNDNDGNGNNNGNEAEEGPRPKRSKADLKEPRQLTPPALTRRSSATPSQGVEMQMPSRPATPRDAPSNGSSNSLSSSHGVKPLVLGPPLQKAAAKQQQQQPQTEKKDIDEDEWANFEADINSLSYDADAAAAATVSAPAMSTTESAAAAAAAAAAQANAEQDKEKESARLEDDREEAARALEEEFDEMQSLEAKVLRLKEKREGIRQRAASSGQMEKAADGGAVALKGKENVETVVEEVVGEGDDDDDDEDESSDDEEDDWDGFRFRAGVTG